MAGSGTRVTRRARFDHPALALNGGAKVRTRPWQDNCTTGEEEKQAALAAIDTGYLSLSSGSQPAAPFSFWEGRSSSASRRSGPRTQCAARRVDE